VLPGGRDRRNRYPRRRSRDGALLLLGQSGEVLLPALQRSRLFAGGPLKIHRKPEWPHDPAGDTSRDVLRHLGTFVAGKVLYFRGVGLDLGEDCRAVRITILRLDNRNRLWWATRTGR